MKYFAGGDTLLPRSIPLYHEIYQGKKKKSKTMLKFVAGKKKKKININMAMSSLSCPLA